MSEPVLGGGVLILVIRLVSDMSTIAIAKRKSSAANEMLNDPKMSVEPKRLN